MTYNHLKSLNLKHFYLLFFGAVLLLFSLPRTHQNMPRVMENAPKNNEIEDAATALKNPLLQGAIDINQATESQLQFLPGIGPHLAQKIIKTRESLGGFKTIEDLKKVKGFGSKKFEKIRTQIKVSLGNEP